MTSRVNENENHVQQKATLASSRNNFKRMNWHTTDINVEKETKLYTGSIGTPDIRMLFTVTE